MAWGDSWGSSWGPLHQVEERPQGGGYVTTKTIIKQIISPLLKPRPFKPGITVVDIDTPRRREEEELLLACIM